MGLNHDTARQLWKNNRKQQKKTDIYISIFNFNNGGVRGIRTLAAVARTTSLAGKPLHHLGITPWLLE
jgi:hypothetical protein